MWLCLSDILGISIHSISYDNSLQQLVTSTAMALSFWSLSLGKKQLTMKELQSLIWLNG